MSKKNLGYLWSYEHADAVTIWDAYNRPSSAKICAYNRILEECIENDGWAVRIPSASHHFFTMAYKCMKDGVETLIYHTHANRYEIKLA